MKEVLAVTLQAVNEPGPTVLLTELDRRRPADCQLLALCGRGRCSPGSVILALLGFHFSQGIRMGSVGLESSVNGWPLGLCLYILRGKREPGLPSACYAWNWVGELGCIPISERTSSGSKELVAQEVKVY